MCGHRLYQVLSQLLQVTQSQHWQIEPDSGAVYETDCLLDFQKEHLRIDNLGREILEAAPVISWP